MTAPLVSVVIPCFNAEPYVAEALDSVLGQTWPNVEVIAVNDGSTDDTLQLLGDFEARGVKVISQPNRGQCAARNRGFKESSGELIKFLDADDIMSPGHIALQVERLGTRRDAIVMAEWARFYGGKPSDAVFEPLPMYRDADPVGWLVDDWMDAQPMTQCGMWLVPRAILDRTGLWDKRLSLIDDFEFFTRVLLGARDLLYASGARLYYRSGRSNNVSGQDSRQAIESAFLSIVLATQQLLNAEDSPRTRRACANIFQNFEYENYPYHPDLRAKARQRVDELGGADIMPVGPPRFHKLRRFVGWRAARRIQQAVGR